MYIDLSKNSNRDYLNQQENEFVMELVHFLLIAQLFSMSDRIVLLSAG